MIEDILAYVGVDWASATHYAYALDAAGIKLGHRSFPHSGEGLVELANWIQTTTGHEPNRAAIGVNGGGQTSRPQGCAGSRRTLRPLRIIDNDDCGQSRHPRSPTR